MPRPSTLTLHQAAEVLDVHYMTAYRYVRTGRLEATKDGDRWQVASEALDALGRREGQTPTKGKGRDYPRRLRDRLIDGDEPGAWSVVEGALAAGTSPAEAYVTIIGASLDAIGDDWAAGRVSVADEHRASAVAQRVIGRMGGRFARPGRKRGGLVVGVVENDRHGLPTALLSDVLRGEGYQVLDLGADTPAECFVETARRTPRLLAIGLSSTLEDNDQSTRSTIDALAEAGVTAPVLVGGRAIPSAAAARALGADGWAADALAAVEAFETAAGAALRQG